MVTKKRGKKSGSEVKHIIHHLPQSINIVLIIVAVIIGVVGLQFVFSGGIVTVGKGGYNPECGLHCDQVSHNQASGDEEGHFFYHDCCGGSVYDPHPHEPIDPQGMAGPQGETGLQGDTGPDGDTDPPDEGTPIRCRGGGWKIRDSSGNDGPCKCSIYENGERIVDGFEYNPGREVCCFNTGFDLMTEQCCGGASAVPIPEVCDQFDDRGNRVYCKKIDMLSRGIVNHCATSQNFCTEVSPLGCPPGKICKFVLGEGDNYYRCVVDSPQAGAQGDENNPTGDGNREEGSRYYARRAP